MRRKIYILLPVHNRKSLTEKFIKCLLNQTYKNFQLVLIDDGSTDGTDKMVVRYLPDTIVIKGKGNWWWGGSLHKGYQWLVENNIDRNELVLIINDDLLIDSDFLACGMKLCELNPKALILAEAYSDLTHQLIDRGINVDWKRLEFNQTEDHGAPNCLSTRGLFFNVGTFLKIGGFYPILLPHYTSDYEFTIRAHRKGIRLLVSNALKVWVNEAETGLHNFDGLKGIKYLKKIFSIKAAANPVYFSSFVLLSCPKRYVPLNLIRIWKGFLTKVF